MRTFFSFFSATVIVSLLGTVFADPQAHEAGSLDLKKRHLGRSRNAGHAEFASEGIVSRNTSVSLGKRFDGTKFSFYEAGQGACGKVNSGDDFIVALNQAQWDGGSHCFDTITITYNGKTAQAQVTDMCPGCPYGGLDFSRGLFRHFASEDAGIIYGSWVFGAGAPEEPKTTKQAPTTTKAPKTSSTPPPPPTTTEAPTTTSTSSARTSTSISPSSGTTQPPSTSSVAASTSQSQVSVSVTESSVPSATPTSTSPQALAQFNQAFFQLAELMGALASRS